MILREDNEKENNNLLEKERFSRNSNWNLSSLTSHKEFTSHERFKGNIAKIYGIHFT